MTERLTILTGDALEQLRTLESDSVQCCVTSPPYFGLRRYGSSQGEIGQEKTPELYVERLVSVFHEVLRVLRNDGTFWLVIADSYNGSGKCRGSGGAGPNSSTGCEPKELIGVPWMLAFSLRKDDWYLRSEITWCKKAPMPEGVTDRPTSATEKVFLFSKSPRYLYNADAVRNPPSEAMLREISAGYNGEALKGFEENGVQNASSVKSRIINGARARIDKQRGHSRRHAGFNDRWDHLTKAEQMACGSNMRNYWVLGPEPYTGNHFATFPSEIPRRAILAGSNPGDTVLDCFLGSGTTGMVALELGRKAIGIELYPENSEQAKQRCDVTPGLPL